MVDPPQEFRVADGSLTPPTFPELYERWLVEPLFRPWVDDLLERVAPAPGDRLLDVACGTGIVARMAHERLGGAGQVAGIDANGGMLAVARAAAPAIDWREGDAVSLPFTDASFDVVVCQQGLQFFADRAAAAREMRRVLAGGGRAGIAVWRPLEEIPFFSTLHRVAERHLGAVTDRRHVLGDALALTALFTDAGFHRVEVETVSRRLHFSDPAMLLKLNAMALVGMVPASRLMPEEDRARLVEAIATDSARVLPFFAGPEGIVFQMSTNVVTARA